MSYWDHIVTCNQFDHVNYKRFMLEDGPQLGWIHSERLALLASFGDVFAFHDQAVTLRDGQDKTAAMDQVCMALQQQGSIQNWRGERYGVKAAFLDDPLFTIERAATPFFGIRGFGIHVNGFVRKSDGLYMWIARRAADRYICPDKLDNIVAGGQPADLSLADNLRKECEEEANIPADIASMAKPVGSIRYCMETSDGVKPDVIFCYDLELPADFQPENTDGEVASFDLLPIAEVASIVEQTDDFKFNCNLVIIDFLIRHGVINPDTDRSYERLIQGLQGFGING